MKWLRRLLLTLLLLALLAAGLIWGALRASLPVYEGQVLLPGLAAPVQLARDERGYLSLSAANRLDAARALGFSDLPHPSLVFNVLQGVLHDHLLVRILEGGDLFAREWRKAKVR